VDREDPTVSAYRESGLAQHFPVVGKVLLERREERVALGSRINEGKEQLGAERKELAVNVGSAADPDRPGVHREFGSERVQVGNDADPRDSLEGSAEDEGLAAGQGASDGLKGVPAHHEDASEGGSLEPLEVGG
jgi:hypothetical protein